MGNERSAVIGETDASALPAGLAWHQRHGLEGGNVSFSDGRAEWQPREDWDDRNWPNLAEKYHPHTGTGGGG